MQNKKKKVAVVSLVVCLIAILSLGSLAWFTANDSVENTLKFVTDFEMDLYETDGHGNKIVNDANETIGQTYENLRPGQTIHKDPTVINLSSEDEQWIRMTVTVDNADVWAQVVEEGADLSTIFTGHSGDAWERGSITKDDTAKTVTYTYYLKSKLAPGATATLFKGVKIPEDLTLAQAKKISESKITVKAEAIQATGRTVTSAKDAFAN